MPEIECPAVGVQDQPFSSGRSTTSTALAPGIPRLHSLRLPIATAGIGMGRVAHLTMGRASPCAVGGLALVSCQSVSATVHRCYAADDKDNGEKTEDQDVEHGPLDHEPLECSDVPSVATQLPHRPGVQGRVSQPLPIPPTQCSVPGPGKLGRSRAVIGFDWRVDYSCRSGSMIRLGLNWSSQQSPTDPLH